ncbi:protein-disulfide reductase DsbD domain-containing protein [Pantoea agglomerans]|uniref:protein-disulfide reductase DsbD family protein n=1 Tax=Enterobacter agglomerans TaxID=549 RepID=UPI00289A97F5|nr:protein-disulfide reductase DsbD domain-containing protein [Pantoea agglomerans]WNK56173.1 protein-disulfide reductase DsbD family protein [Pantoea agglomerans]
MTIIFRSLFLLIALLSVAQADDSGWIHNAKNPHADIRFRSSYADNSYTRVLLDIRLDNGWKTYWRSPGEGGAAPEIVWDSGAKTVWHWPKPDRFDSAGFTSVGYKKRVTFPLEVKTDQQTGELTGTLVLATCSNVCLNTRWKFRLYPDQIATHDFEKSWSQAMARVPASEGPIIVDRVESGGTTLTVYAHKATSWTAPSFYADAPENAVYSEPDIHTEGNKLKAVLSLRNNWGEPLQTSNISALTAVITDGELSQQINASVEHASAFPVWWQTLFFALAGGLILNLMPCVLPVLGMKLAFLTSSHHRDTNDIRKRFLATAAGIITSFILLAALIAVIRLSGRWVGWGFQFQSPWFTGFMVLVTWLFWFSLAGIAELRLPSSVSTRLATTGGAGVAGSFCEGMFATLLATPCTAPFLGTAVTVALAAPLWQLWIIFMALGIGMSLPWLLISAFPRVAAFVPRPGRWLNLFRILLVALMMSSTLWLLSLLIPSVGIRWVSVAAGILLTLFLYGCARAYRGSSRHFYLLALGLLAAAVIYAALPPAAHQTATSSISWRPFSQAALDQALAENKRVFVDITADWCINCKVNEALVLNSAAVAEELNRADVVALKGDWSRPSPQIEAFLQRNGASGIPFNALFTPRQTEGELLPPLLDKHQLLSLLRSSDSIKTQSTGAHNE